MEPFDFIEEADAINSTDDNCERYNQYEVKSIKPPLNINYIRLKIKSNNVLKKRNCFLNIPYICLIDILVVIITIATTITYIIIKDKYIENYKVKDYEGEDDIYLKPKALEHDYLKIIFDNGMTIVLGKVHINDPAGGAIAFDKGYLNNEYEPGYLNLALNAMISDLNNNTTKNEHLKNYIGKIKYSEDEDYSSFYFKILNNGFLKYLQYFPELLHLEQNDIRLEK